MSKKTTVTDINDFERAKTTSNNHYHKYGNVQKLHKIALCFLIITASSTLIKWAFFVLALLTNGMRNGIGEHFLNDKLTVYVNCGIKWNVLLYACSIKNNRYHMSMTIAVSYSYRDAVLHIRNANKNLRTIRIQK